MIRGFLLLSLLFMIALVAVFGFRGQKSTGSPLEVFPDMVRQMKVRAQAPLGLFADGRGPRLPVAGTIPIGYEMPKPETIAPPATAVEAPESRSRIAFSAGTDYYNTGKMGDHWGTGIVTLQDDRIRKMADGEIFNTITNGKNTMMAYGPNIVVADRWAIIAYLRALQRSQNATAVDVPPEHRADLEKP